MKKMEDTTRIGSLFYTLEAPYWVCYYKGPTEQIMLGSIAAAIIASDNDVKNAFMALMNLTIDRILREISPDIDVVEVGTPVLVPRKDVN